MQVNMAFSEVGAILTNDDMRLEIFRQNLSRPNISMAVYLNYSRRFLRNTIDHNLQFRGTQPFGGRTWNITAWNRTPLKHIPNDFNYYLTLDVQIGNFAYSIHMASRAHNWELGGYAHMTNSFRKEEITQPPFVQRTRGTAMEERGWNEATQELFYNTFIAEGPMQWGIFHPNLVDDRLLYLEDFFEYRFNFLLSYSEYTSNYERVLAHARENERTLVLTWQTPLHPSPGRNYMYRVLDGYFDDFFHSYARAIAEHAEPILFRPLNEMNGDWVYYCAFHFSMDTSLFRAVWRHIWYIFEYNGANANSIWVWNPESRSFPQFNWNHELMYYPGDKYVDVVGLTAYNTGTFYHAVGERWREFADLYDGLYARYTLIHSQPLMIPEFASASMGGCKEQWVIDMFAHFPNYPSIRIAMWWNGADFDAHGNIARSYFIDETPRLLEIFRDNLSLIRNPR